MNNNCTHKEGENFITDFFNSLQNLLSPDAGSGTAGYRVLPLFNISSHGKHLPFIPLHVYGDINNTASFHNGQTNGLYIKTK
ncbi:MAG: hypothetical protein IPL84_10735 [Chitinophagaceae bacterium]|nr:hypothetical protein [Chitinophagaceae bacterium]